MIFQPDSLRAWISTEPWQLGAYVCYDLKKIFAMKNLQTDGEIADTALNIAPDTFLATNEFRQFINFRKNKMALLQGKPVDTAQTVQANPYYYDAYRVAGDYSRNKGWYAAAAGYYRQALGLEIATKDERELITEKLEDCEKKLNK